MSKLTSKELDERIEKLAWTDKTFRSDAKQLIRDCIKAVIPELKPQMDTYGDFWASDESMKLHNSIEANTKELLGTNQKDTK